MVAAAESAAYSVPSGPNVSGPMDWNCGPLAAVMTGCTAGAYPMMATNPSMALNRAKRLRITVTSLKALMVTSPHHENQPSAVRVNAVGSGPWAGGLFRRRAPRAWDRYPALYLQGVAMRTRFRDPNRLAVPRRVFIGTLGGGLLSTRLVHAQAAQSASPGGQKIPV